MKLAVYSTKQYDKKYLQQVNESFGFELEFFDFLLTEKTAKTANGCEAVCIFVNDDGSRPVLEEGYYAVFCLDRDGKPLTPAYFVGSDLE